MKIAKFKNLGIDDLSRIMKRSYGTNNDLLPAVEGIMQKVKAEGDKVILGKYRTRYGKKYTSIKVRPDEVKYAYSQTAKQTIKALEQMIKNISLVQGAQLTSKKEKITTPENGISVWREWRPIRKVGLYVPGGKAVYPSSVLMTAIPAYIAGCEEVVVCTPPDREGKVPAATLVAADLIGIKKIYKVGGAEAIAAMAYGTETIPKVFKIYGAGNSYVTAAKLIAMRDVAVDMPAGPSEVFIIADDTANPAYIAADLLADGEHGDDSACILATTSKAIADETAAEVEKQLKNLDTENRARKSIEKFGMAIIFDGVKDLIGFANDYAPEHLEIMTRKPLAIASRITDAGSIFIGDWTSKSAGDYANGANHVLPTGGTAKMYSPLGVDSFGKWMQFQKCTKAGLKKIKQTVLTIAAIEKLPAHINSTAIRFAKNQYGKK